MRYGYCAVGGPILGLAPAESLRREGSAMLQRIDGEKVEYPSLIGDFDGCASAGRFFRNRQVNAVVINFAGWLGGGEVLRLARELENIPLVLWGSGKGPTLTLTCLMEATSDLTKTGRAFFTAIGDPARNETTADIERTLRAIDAFQFLRQANVGYIGYACPGMVDVSPDELSLRRKIGCELFHLDLFELIQEFQKTAGGEEAGRLAEELKKSGAEIRVGEEGILDSARMYLALRNIAERYRLHAFAIRCWPELRDVSPNLHVTPCYALSRLADEGVVGACEADVSAAVTMLLLRKLTGKAPSVLDYSSINEDRNSLGFWHCGPHAASLAESSKNIKVSTPPIGGVEEWGGGCALEFSIKGGKATFAKLSREYGSMSIASGTFVRPEPEIRGGIGEAVMETDAHSYLERLMQLGFEHHVCAVHQDVRAELGRFCKLAQIEAVVH